VKTKGIFVKTKGNFWENKGEDKGKIGKMLGKSIIA
jgi:hypothetical protein